MTCENAQMRRGHSISERELQPTRADGDTAARAVAIDSDLGSERLELHVTRYEPGRSLPRALDGMQEILYAVSGRGTLFVDGEAARARAAEPARTSPRASPTKSRTPARRRCWSSRRPRHRRTARPPSGRRIVRYDDQPSLPASGDREFRYLVTDEVGCRDLTQFFGVIAPGRAPDHSHVYDEVIYVLEGEGMLHIDGEHEPVAAGTCIHLPPLREHSLENSGEGPMKVVAVFHPAGDPASRAYEANE